LELWKLILSRVKKEVGTRKFGFGLDGFFFNTWITWSFYFYFWQNPAKENNQKGPLWPGRIIYWHKPRQIPGKGLIAPGGLIIKIPLISFQLITFGVNYFLARNGKHGTFIT